MLRRKLRDVTRLDRLLAALAAREARRVVDPARREAAVALLLLPEPDRILLIRRAEREGDPWSGQIALPGGRRDPVDGDLLDTALRETVEETGIAVPPAVRHAVLDDLAPVTPALPPIIVRPFAFVLAGEPALAMNDEVAAAEWVPLADLANPAIRRPAELRVRGATLRVEGYHLPAGLLWGMTERILSPVIETWAALGPSRNGIAR